MDKHLQYIDMLDLLHYLQILECELTDNKEHFWINHKLSMKDLERLKELQIFVGRKAQAEYEEESNK